MKLNINQFHKVSSDENKTVLQHPEQGHQITIAHKHLQPKLRAEIESMPMASKAQNMDVGGAVLNAPRQMEMESSDGSAAPQENPNAPSQEVDDQQKILAAQKLWNGENVPKTKEGSYDTSSLKPEAETEVAQKHLEQNHQMSQDYQDQLKRNSDANLIRQQAGLAPIQAPPPPMNMAQIQQTAQGPQQSGLEQSPQVPADQDPYGYNQALKTQQEGMQNVMGGLVGEQQAQSAQGKQESQALQQGMQQTQNLNDMFQQHSQAIDQERQSLMEDVKNGHIDPNQFWEDKTAPAKVSTAIGLILGGMGGGLMGQENPALKLLSGQIDRNIEAQKLNLQNKNNLLNHNRQQFQDEVSATNMTRINLMDHMTQQMQLAAAQAKDPIAKSRLLQAAGQLQQQYAPLIQQTKMRSAIMNGSANGQIDPAVAVSVMVPQHQQEQALKEVAAKKENNDLIQRSLQSFDHLHSMTGHGLFSPSDASSAKNVLASEIEHASLGRLNMDAAKEIAQGLLPSKTDVSEQTIKNKRMRLIQTLKGLPAYQTPTLDANFVKVPGSGAYNQQGQSIVRPGLAPSGR